MSEETVQDTIQRYSDAEEVKRYNWSDFWQNRQFKFCKSTGEITHKKGEMCEDKESKEDNLRASYKERLIWKLEVYKL